MNIQQFFSALRLVPVVGALLICSSAIADPVWHCSRNDVQIADASNNFSLASLEVEREILKLSLKDLYTVYQGSPVKVSGLPLSACFIGVPDATTDTAMKSIGASQATLNTLAKKSGLAATQLFMVQNESEMQSCIARHHPAIGYLPVATHTEAVGPCF